MKATPATASLSEEAYWILRDRIWRGDLPIGQAVSRRKVAAELGMSIVPVSEALRRLELEGLLESRARAGTRVKIPTEEAVRGHYVVREALEVHAARLFAEVATAPERAELLRIAVRVDALAGKTEKDRSIYLSLHEKLHRRIAEGTHCPALCEAIEKNQVLASTWLCVPRPTATNESPRRHQDLVTVLCQESSKAAAEAMRQHIRNALNNTLSRLESHFLLSDAKPTNFTRCRS